MAMIACDAGVSLAAPCTEAAPLKPGEVATGTTIMGVMFAGGIVLGADTRTSTGQFVANRASRKISQVSDKIFICRSGSAADTQALTMMVRNYLGQHALELNDDPAVETAANLFQLIAYNNKDNLMAAMIVGGCDKKGPHLFSIPLGGTIYPVKVYASGSGSSYVQGLIDATYREGMTRAECEAFVAKTISHAMCRDGSSGGMVRLVTITADGAEERCIQGDKLPQASYEGAGRGVAEL